MGRKALAVVIVGSLVGLGLWLSTGDSADPTPPLEMDGSQVLAPNLAETVGISPESAPAVIRQARPEGGGDQAIGLQWTVQPSELQVYRATAVHLRVDQMPASQPNATCLWSFGDGTPSQTGCRISHTYHGGQADQVVTLKLTDGDWTWTTSRPLRLERLPVVKGLLGEETDEAAGLPAPPTEGETNLRIGLVTGPADGPALEQLLGPLKPGLVIHLGGLVEGEEPPSFDRVLREVAKPLREASIPWVPALSPGDLKALGSAGTAEIPAPGIRLLDGENFPRRYSFTYRGAFFLVLSSGGDGVLEDEISWMRDQLSAAGIYAARYVVSPLPLHKFTDQHQGSLNKRFRLYELFLRGRVTAFFSGAYRVYFRGRYGALPVVSVGSMKGPGGTLSGQDFSQKSSLVLIDQVDGVPIRITAAEGPSFDRPMDPSTLPEAVEVYTR